MKPADMLVRHDPDKGAIGDCFRCAVASILDLPADAVPHFMEDDYFKEKDFTWYGRMQAWLAARGLTYFEVQVQDAYHGPRWFEHIAAGGFSAFHTMSGMSPRGYRHTVVAHNGVMVHDPHPDRAGLSEAGEDGWQYGFFILRDASVDRSGHEQA